MEKQTLARADYALRGGSPSVAGTTVSPSGRFSRYGCACAQNDKLYRRVRVILYGLTLFNRTKRTRFLSGALVEKSPAEGERDNRTRIIIKMPLVVVVISRKGRRALRLP